MLIRIVLPAAMLALAAPAFAEPVSVAVPYGDLDLTKAEGRKTLDLRLARAMRRVCGETATARDVASVRNVKACLADVHTRVAPQVALALDTANARRVAVLADKLYLAVRF